jgi:hypothetical protein
MNRQQFEHILRTYVVPMFAGATVEDGGEAPHVRQQRRLGFQLNGQEIVVRSSSDADYQLKIRRAQYFQPEDADFVDAFLEKLEEIDAVAELAVFNDLINPTIRRTVSEQLSQSAADLIYQVLVQFENWSEQTYEGRRIAAAVGIDPTNQGGSGVPLMDVYAKSFGAVLANGLDSFLTAAQNGDIIAYEPVPQVPSSASLFAPIRFARLAEWSTGGKIGLGLNRNGEILLFKDKKLIFSKRRGRWLHFTHDAVIKRVGLHRSIAKEVCTAIYQTCLDVSFARTGGCVAVARRTEKAGLLSSHRVNAADQIGSTGLKGRCLGAIVGRPFQELDRRLRQDIVAMDGATVLDYKGNLIAAGAIVEVRAGSDGGGRLAASKALAKYGLAIKISSDGEIRGFSSKGGTILEMFSVG